MSKNMYEAKRFTQTETKIPDDGLLEQILARLKFKIAELEPHHHTI